MPFWLVLDEKVYSLESAMKRFEISSEKRKKQIASASSALTIGGFLGLLQAAFLITAARPLLGFMGVKHVRITNTRIPRFPPLMIYPSLDLLQGSEMSTPAEQYLKLRSVGAPAVLLSLAMQGVFRGLKDTKTPLYATGLLLILL